MDLRTRKEPRRVLMCSPDFFDIIDIKNPYMAGHSGQVNKIEARTQWETLKGIYDKWVAHGYLDEVLVIDGVENCEDMVFCANQSFPFLDSQNNKQVIMSKMKHASRQKEVPFFKEFYHQQNYNCIELQHTELFEGMGDTIPHPGKLLYYGGYGHRSSANAYDEIGKLTQSPIIPLELVSENFYHLDTCFVPLSENAVMLCKEAFTEEGINQIKTFFNTVYFIDEKEAIDTFCLNAHLINYPENNKKVAVLQKGSTQAKQALLTEGFEIEEIETSAFMKSGGSVFCMKMMIY
jgi:N-dimethylarginine dimethylaminohydrolase